MIGRRRRASDDRPIPDHPYRDSAILYLVMAVVLVIVATATGGSPAKAVLAAVVFFLLATAWSWWRFHAKIMARDRALEALVADEAAQAPAAGRGDANGNGRGGAR